MLVPYLDSLRLPRRLLTLPTALLSRSACCQRLLPLPFSAGLDGERESVFFQHGVLDGYGDGGRQSHCDQDDGFGFGDEYQQSDSPGWYPRGSKSDSLGFEGQSTKTATNETWGLISL